MKRLFIASNISLETSFSDLIRELKKHCRYDQIMWMDDHLMHLTIRFIGKTSKMQIPVLLNIIEEICSQTEPFSLILDKLGVFGSRYAPDVLWFGFQHFEKMKALFEKLETLLLKNGFEAHQGNFVPHVTIGRIKQIDNKKKFFSLIESSQPTIYQEIPIFPVLLYQSILHKEGPEYKIIKNGRPC